MRDGDVSRPLVVGSCDDPHVEAVANALPGGASQAILLDVSRLETSELELHDDSLVLSNAVPEQLCLSAHRRGWIRRLVPAGWDHDVRIGTHDAALKASWLSLLAFLVRSTETRWLTTLDDVVGAENKLLQYHVARRCGVPVPRTAVCSDPIRAAALVGEPMVVKPLGPGHFYDDGDPKIVFTTELKPEDVPASEFGRAPFLVQERLHPEQHLRVVTVGHRAWACQLDAAGRSIDWRADDEAHGSFTPTRLPRPLEAQAIAVADGLGCGFSSQDWAVVEGKAYFLDLNPAGQWLFLPEAVATAVTVAIASWLSS